MDTSKTEISITLSITIWGYPSQYSHYTLPDTVYHCWNTCDSSNEAHLNLDRMYPKLHRDVSGAASRRTRCYVGTQFREQHWRLYGKNSIKNNRHWTEKTPFCSMPPAFCLKNTAKNHQKLLSIAIFMAIYGRLWQLKSYCNIGIN